MDMQQYWMGTCHTAIVIRWCTQAEGMELIIEDMVGATGLELKSDPGVPYVYAGFAGACTSAPAFRPHSSTTRIDLISALCTFPPSPHALHDGLGCIGRF